MCVRVFTIPRIHFFFLKRRIVLCVFPMRFVHFSFEPSVYSRYRFRHRREMQKCLNKHVFKWESKNSEKSIFQIQVLKKQNKIQRNRELEDVGSKTLWCHGRQLSPNCLKKKTNIFSFTCPF